MRTARACSLVACLMTWLTLWSQQYIYNMVEDSLNYLFVIQAPGQTSFHYWLAFCADMEQQSPYHTASSWFAALPSWHERLLCPLKIRVGRVKVSKISR